MKGVTVNTDHRAALMLHAMAAGDRNWILQSLPDVQSARLQVLLDELLALGIPKDTSLVAQVVKSLAPESDPIPNTRPSATPVGALASAARLTEDGIGYVEAVPIARLLAILKTEPTAVIALLLSLHSWPWQEALLLGLGMRRQQAVRECLAGRAANAGHAHTKDSPLRHALLDRLTLRIRAMESPVERVPLRHPAIEAGPGEHSGGRFKWRAIWAQCWRYPMRFGQSARRAGLAAR